MSEEEPLDVQVARALGWTDFDKDGYYGAHPPYYSTDWSATGPLIQKFCLYLEPDAPVTGNQEWLWKAYQDDTQMGWGKTPLEAVCKWIVEYHR